MIYVVCGMIGAGKTTFAKMQNGILSDFDELQSKEKQIEFTLKNREKEVYHTTCFPTFEELKNFEGADVKYIWINTSFTKCKENIIARNRLRDTLDLRKTLEKNREIQKKYQGSSMKFEVINTLKSDERW